eukprot:246138_1
MIKSPTDVDPKRNDDEQKSDPNTNIDAIHTTEFEPPLEREIRLKKQAIFTDCNPIPAPHTINVSQLYFVDDNIYLTYSYENLRSIATVAIEEFIKVGLAFNHSKLKFFTIGANDDDVENKLHVDFDSINRLDMNTEGFIYLGYKFMHNGTSFNFIMDLMDKCQSADKRISALMVSGFTYAMLDKKREIYYAHVESIIYKASAIELFEDNHHKILNQTLRKYASLCHIPRNAPLHYFNLIYGVKPSKFLSIFKFLSFYHHTVSGVNHKLTVLYLQVYVKTKCMTDYGIIEGKKKTSFRSFAAKTLYALKSIGLEEYWQPHIIRATTKANWKTIVSTKLNRIYFDDFKTKTIVNRHNLLKHMKSFQRSRQFGNKILKEIDNALQYETTQQRETNRLLIRWICGSHRIVWQAKNRCRLCNNEAIETIHLITNCDVIKKSYGEIKYELISKEWLNLALVYQLLEHIKTNFNILFK